MPNETDAELTVPVAEPAPELQAQEVTETPEVEAAETPAVISQPTIDEEAIAERITQRAVSEMDARMGARLEEAVSRLKQSQRDSIEQRFRQLYQQQAHVIDDLVAGGVIDAQTGLMQKAQLRDKVDQQALQAAEQSARTEQQQQQPQGQGNQNHFNKAWFAALQEYELDQADPEMKDLAAIRITSADFDSAVAEARRAIRRAAKKKEQRVAQTIADQTKQAAEKKKAAQAKAVIVDTGTSNGGGGVTRASLEAEAEKLTKQAPSSLDSEGRKARLKRLGDIADQLDKFEKGAG